MQEPCKPKKRNGKRKFLPLTLAAAVALMATLTAVAGKYGKDVNTENYTQAKTKVLPVGTLPTYDPAPVFTSPERGILPNALVQREVNSKKIRRITGKFRMAGAKSPGQAAALFLGRNRTSLKLSGDLRELETIKEAESLSGYHVYYKQMYNGLPVFGGYLSVNMNKNFEIESVNDDTLVITQPRNVVAPFNPVVAIAAAVAAVGSQSGPIWVPTAEAGVTVQDGRPVSAWKVMFDTAKPAAAWEVFVNGETNQVISTRNVARYIDGSGLVYLPDPVRTSGIATLTDNNNATSPQLDAERFPVVIKGLTQPSLTGVYASTAPSTLINRATSPTFTFNFNRSQDGFDETMCYYHIDAVQRRIQELGFFNVNNRQTGVNVNGIPDDNAFYSPSTKNVTFGTGGVNDAQDAEVPWHEMGHAIQDNQVPGWGATVQGGSMGEGFSDYWAGSRWAGTGPNAPAWDIYVGTWDAVSYNPGNPAFLRVLNTTKVWPTNSTGEVHADGEMWSASLWQLRQLVGRDRADTTILDAHFRLSTSATFEDGANAIIASNLALYNDNIAAVKSIFIARGFIQAAAAPSAVTATAVSSSQVDLTWVDNSNNETQFKIERKTGSGTYAQIATVAVNVTTYSDTTTAPNTSYSYRVRASAVDGDSRYSNEAGVTTPIQTYSIAGTVTEASAGLGSVDVTATGTGTFPYLQSDSPALAIPDNNTTGVTATMNVTGVGTLSDIRIGVNVTHTFIGDLEITLIAPDNTEVKLHNLSGGSADNIVTSYPDLTVPAESLAVLAGKQINGTWKLRIRDLAAIDVGTLNTWSLNINYNGSFSRTATTASNGTYSLTGLYAATYAVQCAKSGYAFNPDPLSVTVGPDQTGKNFTATPGAPATPTNLNATTANANQINLAWTDVATNESSYKVERKLGAGAFAEIAVLPANSNSYQDTGVQDNLTYSYRVRASNATGNSPYSNTATATTPVGSYTISGTVTTGEGPLSGATLSLSGPGALQTIKDVSPNLAIPDNNTTGVEAPTTITQTGTLTGIKVGIDITHTYIGDLEVSVVAPDGTAVILHNRAGGSADNIVTSYPDLTTPAQSLSALIGKQINGTWKIKVRDLAGADVGTLNTYRLTLDYSGITTYTASSAADGTFSFSSLRSATYTLVPRYSSYVFTPSSRSVTVGPSKANQDFYAAPPIVIRRGRKPIP